MEGPVVVQISAARQLVKGVLAGIRPGEQTGRPRDTAERPRLAERARNVLPAVGPVAELPVRGGGPFRLRPGGLRPGRLAPAATPSSSGPRAAPGRPTALGVRRVGRGVVHDSPQREERAPVVGLVGGVAPPQEVKHAQRRGVPHPPPLDEPGPVPVAQRLERQVAKRPVGDHDQPLRPCEKRLDRVDQHGVEHLSEVPPPVRGEQLLRRGDRQVVAIESDQIGERPLRPHPDLDPLRLPQQGRPPLNPGDLLLPPEPVEDRLVALGRPAEGGRGHLPGPHRVAGDHHREEGMLGAGVCVQDGRLVGPHRRPQRVDGGHREGRVRPGQSLGEQAGPAALVDAEGRLRAPHSGPRPGQGLEAVDLLGEEVATGVAGGGLQERVGDAHRLRKDRVGRRVRPALQVQPPHVLEGDRNRVSAVQGPVDGERLPVRLQRGVPVLPRRVHLPDVGQVGRHPCPLPSFPMNRQGLPMVGEGLLVVALRPEDGADVRQIVGHVGRAVQGPIQLKGLPVVPERLVVALLHAENEPDVVEVGGHLAPRLEGPMNLQGRPVPLQRRLQAALAPQNESDIVQVVGHADPVALLPVEFEGGPEIVEGLVVLAALLLDVGDVVEAGRHLLPVADRPLEADGLADVREGGVVPAAPPLDEPEVVEVARRLGLRPGGPRLRRRLLEGGPGRVEPPVQVVRGADVAGHFGGRGRVADLPVQGPGPPVGVPGRAQPPGGPQRVGRRALCLGLCPDRVGVGRLCGGRSGPAPHHSQESAEEGRHPEQTRRHENGGGCEGEPDAGPWRLDLDPEGWGSGALGATGWLCL